MEYLIFAAGDTHKILAMTAEPIGYCDQDPLDIWSRNLANHNKQLASDRVNVWIISLDNARHQKLSGDEAAGRQSTY